jgi:phosphoribosylglycinamide formyltransferase-1
MIKLGILISGGGSNLQAIIDAIDDKKLDAEIVTVISDKPDAFGLSRAKKASLRSVFIDPNSYMSETVEGKKDFGAYNDALRDELQSQDVDYVVMAGYMRLLGKQVLDAFPNKVVNLHPALLPSFRGANGISDAFDYGVKVTGITVHFADEYFDRGPIIAQVPVTIEENDTIESLEKRIHAAEHVILPTALQWIAQGKVSVEGRRVCIGSE